MQSEVLKYKSPLENFHMVLTLDAPYYVKEMFLVGIKWGWSKIDKQRQYFYKLTGSD